MIWMYSAEKTSEHINTIEKAGNSIYKRSSLNPKYKKKTATTNMIDYVVVAVFLY